MNPTGQKNRCDGRHPGAPTAVFLRQPEQITLDSLRKLAAEALTLRRLRAGRSGRTPGRWPDSDPGDRGQGQARYPADQGLAAGELGDVLDLVGADHVPSTAPP